jgi:non-ribosomal peptide synthetase component E (peptide arylation enzyme)
MKFHRPHIKLTPFLLSSLAKSYFQVNSNKAKHQAIFLWKWLYQCRHTAFGKQYNIEDIASIDAFQQQVPIHHYDTMQPGIEQAMRGEKNIISPGHISWFATSSGTTGVSKYIPVTKKSLQTNHFKA